MMMRGTIIVARKNAKIRPPHRVRLLARASTAKPPIQVASSAVANATRNERTVACNHNGDSR